MSVIKKYCRPIIYALIFIILRFSIDNLHNIILKEKLIDLGTYSSVTREISLHDYGISFLIVFLPFLIASLCYNFFIKDFISISFYWIIALFPIFYYVWISLLVFTYGGLNGFLLYFLNPVFLFIGFYYNYKMIDKSKKYAT